MRTRLQAFGKKFRLKQDIIKYILHIILQVISLHAALPLYVVWKEICIYKSSISSLVYTLRFEIDFILELILAHVAKL